jgi:hypothetical protein
MRMYYYDDETENLLEEEDAEETTYEQWLEELFHLNDDDESYIGLIASDSNKYRIKCDSYDSYKVYRFNRETLEYDLIDLVNFEECKSYFTMP